MASISEVIQIVGAGRMGTAMVSALREAGIEAPDAGSRGETAAGADVVILAVPDAAIAEAAQRIEPGRVVGHLSGATPLAPLMPHECFSLHPLMTVAGGASEPQRVSPFEGVHAAVSASSERARDLAERLAHALGMIPFALDERDRAAYHAAASIASNFLVTLEWFAERLAHTTHLEREALVPLVTATVRNWVEMGSERALTGPVARGDIETVDRQRAAVAERLPDQLALFDALVTATQQLADSREGR